MAGIRSRRFDITVYYTDLAFGQISGVVFVARDLFNLRAVASKKFFNWLKMPPIRCGQILQRLACDKACDLLRTIEHREANAENVVIGKPLLRVCGQWHPVILAIFCKCSRRARVSINPNPKQTTRLQR